MGQVSRTQRLRPSSKDSRAAAAAAAKSLQSCPTLCDPIDGSPPGSPVPGVLQARTLEWVKLLYQFWAVYLWTFPWKQNELASYLSHRICSSLYYRKLDCNFYFTSQQNLPLGCSDESRSCAVSCPMDRYTWQGTESSQEPSKELVPLDQQRQETESCQ